MNTTHTILDRLNAQLDLEFWGAWFYDHSDPESAMGISDSLGAFLCGGEL
jgi:hypothetical protein